MSAIRSLNATAECGDILDLKWIEWHIVKKGAPNANGDFEYTITDVLGFDENGTRTGCTHWVQGKSTFIPSGDPSYRAILYRLIACYNDAVPHRQGGMAIPPIPGVPESGIGIGIHTGGGHVRDTNGNGIEDCLENGPPPPIGHPPPPIWPPTSTPGLIDGAPTKIQEPTTREAKLVWDCCPVKDVINRTCQ